MDYEATEGRENNKEAIAIVPQVNVSKQGFEGMKSRDFKEVINLEESRRRGQKPKVMKCTVEGVLDKKCRWGAGWKEGK